MSTNQTNEQTNAQHNDQPIICDLTAIPTEMREQHVLDATDIFQKAEEIQELAQGYAFRFPNEAGMWSALASFVEYDRRCCPFYRFGLTAEANHGSLWLTMTGPEGTKDLLNLSLVHTGGEARLDQAVAQLAGTLSGLLG